MAKLKIKTRFGVTPIEVLNNTELSMKAKGLFAYIQSKPDNWDFSANRIAADCKDGRDSIRSGLQELEKAGYLRRIRTRSEAGQWEIEYELAEKPVPGNPTSGNPTSEKPSIKKDRRSKKEIVKKITTTNVVEAEPKNPQEFGNPDINWVLGEFENIMGFKSAGRGKKDRIFARHLLNNYSQEQIQALMGYCATNEYAPRVGSVEKLWFKRGDVIAGIRAAKNKSTKLKIREI